MTSQYYLDPNTAKLVFVIGHRRGGTTITMHLLRKQKGIQNILFEPHPWVDMVKSSALGRLADNPCVTNSLAAYERLFQNQSGWIGLKMPMNPGLECLDWKFLEKRYPFAKFVFSTRNAEDTYRSLIKAETGSIREMEDLPFENYEWFHNKLTKSFEGKVESSPEKAIIIEYEKLIEDANGQMAIVCEFLGNCTPVDVQGEIGTNKVS